MDADLPLGRAGFDIDATTAGPARIVSGQSGDDGWSATIDGRDAGSPRSFDTQATWRVEDVGSHRLEASYDTQGVYRVVLLVTAALGLCVLLLVRMFLQTRPRRRGLAVAVVVFGVVIGGWSAAWRRLSGSPWPGGAATAPSPGSPWLSSWLRRSRPSSRLRRRARPATTSSTSPSTGRSWRTGRVAGVLFVVAVRIGRRPARLPRSEDG